MKVLFECRMGVPAPLKAKYDGRSKAVLTAGKASAVPRFSVISANLKLKIYFSAETGDFCGIKFSCPRPQFLTASCESLPLGMDGYIKCPVYNEGVNVVAWNCAAASYNPENKLLFVRLSEEREGCCYHIAESVYVVQGSDGDLVSVCFQL